MLGFYLVLMTVSIVTFSFVALAKIKKKEKKLVYVFSQELFDCKYAEFIILNCLKRYYKLYEQMRKEEFK